MADQTQHTRAVGVDPAGALMATGDDSGQVVVRRAPDGLPTGVVVDAGGPVSGLALGPDSLLVTATYDGRLRVWDASSGAPRTGVKQTGEGSLVVAVSADGLIIATGGESNVIRLWDQGLRQTAELEGHTHWVRALAFMPPGSGPGDTLVSAGADGVAYLWTSLTTAAIPTALGQRSSLMRSLAISPDGETIATGNAEGQVILWDSTESEARASSRPILTGHDGTVTGIAYGPSGDWMLTADASGTVRLWAADSGLDPWGSLGRVGALSGLVVVSDEQAFTVGADGPARWALAEQEWRRIACATAGRDLRAEEAVRHGFPQPPPTCTGAR
jgi:WD40 repeat protein